jgi:hypothetical protein
MSNATASVSSVSLVAKSAKELRELLAAGATTPAAVIAHLSAKATLRDQSQRLLNELTGVKPAKAAKKVAVAPAPAPTPVPVPVPAPAPAPAPEAKAEKKAPRVSNEAILAAIEGLAGRMDALEAKVDKFASFLATVESAKAAIPAAPVAPVRTGEILVPVEPVVEPVIEEEVPGDDAPLSWAEAKARYATESVSGLREMLKGLDLPTNGKKEALIERLLACYVELELVLPAPVAATAKTTSVVAEF